MLYKSIFYSQNEQPRSLVITPGTDFNCKFLFYFVAIRIICFKSAWKEISIMHAIYFILFIYIYVYHEINMHNKLILMILIHLQYFHHQTTYLVNISSITKDFF